MTTMATSTYCDILLTGYTVGTVVSKIYRNDERSAVFASNTPPSVPTGLNSLVFGQSVLLVWDAATDIQTPADSLTYNIRVGTASVGVDTVSPMADGSTGWRMIPAMGRAGHCQLAILKNIDPSKGYYWSVQAVDTALEGSAWSNQASFGAVQTRNVVSPGGGGSSGGCFVNTSCSLWDTY